MKKVLSCLTIVILSFIFVSYSLAEDTGDSLWPVPDYTGDLSQREALTGDWGGKRTEWAEKGVTFSVTNVSTYQSVIDGGKEEDDAFGGSNDYELHLDFDKMGLWPGAFVRLYGETQYGNFINNKTGAVLAANTDGLLPLVDEDTTTLTGAIFYQFLHERFALFLGKIDTLDGDQNEFAHGRGNDQFLNQNLVFNPVTLRTTPVSAFGGGMIFLLPRETDVLAISVLDPSGQADEWDLSDAFDDGTFISAELRMEVNPFNKKGHQTFGYTYSTKNFASTDQNLRLILLNLVTGAPLLAREDSSWSFYYNFDQYFYTEADDPEQGIGLFGRFGIADDKTSPIEDFWSIGIGGKGVIPGRDNDTFGLGYFHVGLSDKLPSVFDVLDDGKGFEIFYNIEVKPWFNITPDFQIIDSGLNTRDTAYVFGLRVKTDL